MFREVKASKRLPKKVGRYIAIYKNGNNFRHEFNPKDLDYDWLNLISAWLEPIDITKIIEEIEDLHPYKQSGDRDSYSDYSQGWADACDVILSRLEN